MCVFMCYLSIVESKNHSDWWNWWWWWWSHKAPTKTAHLVSVLVSSILSMYILCISLAPKLSYSTTTDRVAYVFLAVPLSWHKTERRIFKPSALLALVLILIIAPIFNTEKSTTYFLCLMWKWTWFRKLFNLRKSHVKLTTPMSAI